ncbi:MAG: hypothetical protein IPG53_03950 [Ignavibacteriales bacterium]|nr:hypothetical protein [Ignavibacteriales bacterium]
MSGAAGNYWRWHFRFDRFYAKNDVTGFYRNSLIINHYPFSLGLKRGYEPGGQADIQFALNNLIEYKGERILPYSGNEDPDQFMGLVTAIDAAQNFGPELEEDIPLIQTVQVSAIRGFVPGIQLTQRVHLDRVSRHLRKLPYKLTLESHLEPKDLCST